MQLHRTKSLPKANGDNTTPIFGSEAILTSNKLGCTEGCVLRKNNFAKDERGTTAVTFAALSLCMLSVIGAAIDTSRAISLKSKLQSLADASALSAAAADVDTNDERTVVAQSTFAAGADVSGVQPSVTFNENQVTVSADYPLPTLIMGLAGVTEMPLAVSSTAAAMAGERVCMLALDPTMEKAFDLSGSAEITASGCAVQANSKHNNAFHAQGGATAAATNFCTPGGSSNPNAFSPKVEKCRSVKDPFAHLTPPPIGGCDFTNIKLKKGSHFLTPGVYCGGFVITNQALVFFAPGMYVIKDGGLSFATESISTGTGVTFHFSGSGTYLNISSSAVVNLSGPTSGPYEGLIFYQDPTSNPGQTNGNSNLINGSGSVHLVGSMYFPTQELKINGGGSFGANSPLMSIVAKNFVVSGEMELKLDMEAAGMSPKTARVFDGSMLVN